MALSLYDASIPVYLQMLKNLVAIVDKAEAHAKETGADVATWLEARLAPDMHPLSRQFQMVSDAAKGGAARLAGIAPPSMPDVETSWAELRERLTRTIDFVASISREQVEGDETRTIELQLPGRTMTFTARDFLFTFSLPNFFFHVTTAYALLRAQGAPLGKMDFLAGGRAG
ncbi:MAG TPA: DUF1993 domain-containing protein [Caulobacteraceae bacterium]|nr:DUF1993 domain-containing protein [Caulobacteraceae bacterium]